MPDYCAVPGCLESGLLFSFPADPTLNLRWRVAIRRKGPDGTLWKPTPGSVVCERHFKPEDFKTPLVLSGRSSRRLKEGVVPSFFNIAFFHTRC